MLHNSSALWHHKQHLKEFLDKRAKSNQLMVAVADDLNNPYIMAEVHALALINVFITEPFFAVIQEKKQNPHILDLNPILAQIQTTLQNLSEDPSLLLQNTFTPWHNFSFQSPLKDSAVLDLSHEYMNITLEVIGLVATYILVDYTRMEFQQLPSGIHGTDSVELREEAKSVPKSNAVHRHKGNKTCKLYFYLLIQIQVISSEAETELRHHV